MSEESSPAIPTTSDNEAKENSGTKTQYRVCSGIVSLALAIPAIVIASKYLDDQVSACRKDATWLLVFGINLIVYMLFGTILEKYKFLGSLFSLYKFGWSIYGVVLFTKAESAEKCASQLHTFGYVLAILSIIGLSLFVCCCGCMTIMAILGGGSQATATAEGAQVDDEGEAALVQSTDKESDEGEADLVPPTDKESDKVAAQIV